MYWGNYDHGRIGKAANSGSPANPSFIETPVGPFGVAAFENTLYWADYDTGMIGRADVSGSSPAGVNASFITGQDGVFAVAANEAYVYWGTVGGAIGRAALNPDGSVASRRRVVRRRAPATSRASRSQRRDLLDRRRHNRIGRATLNADGSLNSVDTQLLSVNGAAGIAYADGRLYWANSTGGSIGRADVAADGTLSGIDQSLITGASDPAGVSVLGRDIAWTNMSSSQPTMGSLSRAHLAADGTVDSVSHEIAFETQASSASRSTRLSIAIRRSSR